MGTIPSPFENFLQMRIIEQGDGTSQIGLSYRKEITNFHGIYHGGAIASVADTAAVQALRTIRPGPYLTVELLVHYKNPSQANEIFAEARAFPLKGKIFQSDVVIRDSDNTLVAEATVKSFLPGAAGSSLRQEER